jgi:hypothetical protein
MSSAKGAPAYDARLNIVLPSALAEAVQACAHRRMMSVSSFVRQATMDAVSRDGSASDGLPSAFQRGPSR